MNDEKEVPMEYSRNSSCPAVEGVNVLVVDSDAACLKILSRMLSILGYQVITAERASDALKIVQQKEEELHLVLTEVHLPDMDKYELLEKLRSVSKLPVVIVSDDNDENAMLGGLFKGAVYYIVKPVTMDRLKNLWQFAFINKRDAMIDFTEEEEETSFHYGESPLDDLSNDQGFEIENFMRKDLENRRRQMKRNNPEGTMERGDSHSSAQKKQKMVWTYELHKRFLQAVRLLGVENSLCDEQRVVTYAMQYILLRQLNLQTLAANVFLELGAHPKKILQHMNIPGLRKECVSSHLQKYRLSLRREQEAIMKTRVRKLKALSFPPYNYCSAQSTFQGGFSNKNPNPNRHSKSTTYQQELLRGQFQNLSSSHVSRPSAGSSSFPIHLDSSEDSNFINGQPTLSHNNYYNSGFGGQAGSFNVGEGNNNFNNFNNLHTNLQVPSSPLPPPPPHEQQQTEGFGNEDQLEAQAMLSPLLQIPSPPPAAAAGEGEQGQENDLFRLANQLLMSPQWEMPSMPSLTPAAGGTNEQEKHIIFGTENVETMDELFETIAEDKTQQFSDFDFNFGDLW